MTLEMVCNFRKCRKPLTNHAWVTTCSHAFCIEHGQREFKRNIENSLTCPACGSELRDKFDVIQADLKPSETFKSIVLAGMKPDTIIDVTMRAMSFWSYQIEQETLYQESLARHSKEKLQSLEEVNTLNLQKLNAELETCKRKIIALQTECNKKKKQSEELTACMEINNRKVQKLQFQVDALKRKDIHVANYEMTNNNEKLMEISDLVGKRTKSEAFVFRPINDGDKSQSISSPSTSMFDFRNRSKQPDKNKSFKFRPVRS